METPDRLVLGTVQWGMRYGIANRTGMPSLAEIERILDVARASGVRTLDTARSYEAAEDRIGTLTRGDDHWRIVTKLGHDVYRDGATAADAISRTRQSLDASLRHLRQERLETVLLHRAAHRTVCDGAIWRQLLEQRSEGLVEKLGLSAATPDEAWDALTVPEMEVVQVACSLLDKRLLKQGFFEQAAAARKEIFVRSIWLQGVAHLAADVLPDCLAPLREPLQSIRRWCNDRCYRVWEAFLLFIRDRIPSVRVVIGCETVEQLKQNIEAFQRPPLSDDDLGTLEALVPPLGANVLNPSLWSVPSIQEAGPTGA